MAGGYLGRIARVDLSSGAVDFLPWDEEFARAFVGGSGLAARYLWDALGPEVDPLGPDAPLLFMTGPLVGTAAPACGRYEVCGRSPLTGLWGESNSGGFFGPELRFAGVDGLWITGQAPEPVYLWMRDGEVSLRPARHLWGLDTYATQDALREELGDRRVRVACIGPAGENRVRFAAILNDHGRAAGRTGLGAVLGAKNLKAIAVRGSGTVPLADPEGFARIARETWNLVKEDVSSQLMQAGGTLAYMDWALMSGDITFRYYTRGAFAGAERLTGAVLADELLIRPRACYRCPIGCGRETRAERYGVPAVDGPEYETVGTYAALLASSDLEGAAYASHLCNRLGLDTISAGSTIAFAYYLYQEGLLPPERTGGLALRWGELEPALRLTEQIARREGLGDLLAEGARRVGQALGVEDLAVHVKGLEAPMHDPRAFAGTALVYTLSPRGACHMAGDVYMVHQGQVVPELGIDADERQDASEATVRMVAGLMDWRSLTNSLILCHFQNPPLEHVLEMLRCATGWEWSAEDLAQAGERIFTLKRVLNHQLGMTRADDRLPSLLLRPLPDGETGGYVPDVEGMLETYYRLRGWDPATARPLPDTLEKLGLGFAVPALWGKTPDSYTEVAPRETARRWT